MDKVLERISDSENKLSTFNNCIDELDKSKSNTISLLSELNMMVREIDISDDKYGRD